MGYYRHFVRDVNARSAIVRDTDERLGDPSSGCHHEPFVEKDKAGIPKGVALLLYIWRRHTVGWYCDEQVLGTVHSQLSEGPLVLGSTLTAGPCRQN